MSYYVADIPAEPIVVTTPPDFDVTLFDAAAATLRLPDGTSVSAGITAAIGTDDDADAIEVTLPAGDSLFDDVGIYRLNVVLTAGTSTQRIPSLRFVVQPVESEWHTLDTIREEWEDAEHIADPVLWEMLEIVREQVLDFAPTLAEDAPVPANYRLGQRMQTRNTWNAARVSPDGGTGEGDFIIRPYPLDWHVKQILRPKRGKPVVV
jgi:hypothetical protein